MGNDCMVGVGGCGIAVIRACAALVAVGFGVRMAKGSPAVRFVVVLDIALALAKSDGKRLQKERS